MLASILGGGRSSRLFRGVVGPNAASTVDASNFTFGDIGLFQIQASFDEKNRAETDRRILQEIERIKDSGPNAFELQLAKNGIESGAVMGLESVLGQAQGLSEAEAQGDYRKLSSDLQKLAAVTAKDVAGAARRYLNVENMTLYAYRPKGAAESTRDATLAAVQQAAASAQKPKLEEIAPPAAPAPVRPAAALQLAQQSKLSNGATLIVNERPGVPVIATGIYFRGGRAAENSTIAGVTQLMTRAMKRGTATRSGEQIDREIEYIGTQIGSMAGRDYFGFAFTVPSKSYRPAVALASDVILNPSFPAAEVTREKFQQIAAIRRAADSSMQRPFQLADEAMYRNHPYALPVDGYANSVEALDPAGLRAWWQQTVNASNAVIVVSGDIATDEARAILEAALAPLPAGTAAAATSLPVPQLSRSEVVEFRDRKQSAIVVAFPGAPLTSPDYARLELLQTVAAGGGGTLFTELRSKRSLAYTVTARNGASGSVGSFMAYMASDASKEETARARGFYVGSKRIFLERNAARVSEAAANFFAGLPPDHTQQVIDEVSRLSIDDLRATAAKYLGGNDYVVAIVRGKF